MEAAVLRCPGCGAPAATDAPACAHCASRLAAVACPGCFAMMFAGSRNCPHGGARPPRRDAAPAAALPCPRCRRPLGSARVGTADVGECAACGGVWLDPETFQRVCEEREEQAAVMAAAPGLPEAAPEPVRYAPCPACGEMMARVNFQRISGVVLDQCRRHGTWFDRDELRRVVEFIRGGGMDRARRREVERLAEERRRLESAQREAARASRPYAGLEWSDDREPAGPLGTDLVGLLVRIVRGR